MSEDKKEKIAEMVETALYLAENDPQSLAMVKSNMDILKARCDMEAVMAKQLSENAGAAG